MVFRLIEQFRRQDEVTEATGTYADGAFPALSQALREAGELQPRLRNSYERDLATARRLAEALPVFH
ncbi:hypothetical protein [Rhizobium sp. CSW-27]|uniref:hypothetical protein n=1 Tax=Rhizobium sp. CSW-27 TaxID=2839985 RepID=UPI001C00F840|nr:hypothetical protein [Rhizobium sp. CSW-27]MBT9371085.1 hypothetical protein [Rhizobium sp. CSW-27]